MENVRHMELELHIMSYNRHKSVVGLNQQRQY
jgi:hypothetical protein